MNNIQKEEISFIPLTEAIYRNDLDIETYSKLRFFITHSQIDPQLIVIDLQKNIFYNTVTYEVYEVINNPHNNQYEIVKHKNINQQQSQHTTNLNMSKPKVRTRKLEQPPFMNNAAFTKIGFLIMNIVTLSLLIATIILLNK